MHFPPSRASGVYRPLAMANYLADCGWRVTVVTVSTDFFERITRSSDPSLEGAVHPAVEVVRAPMPLQHLESDIRRYSYAKANFPVLHGRLWSLVQTRLFPERYASWIPGVVQAVLRAHRRQAVSVVLATGNPWSAFAAAWIVKRLARIPYVMDYRDSWTLDQFNVRDTFPPEHPAWQWERRLIREAARVVFVNQKMVDWHADRYPEARERMVVVENGWDADLLGAPAFRPADPDRPLRLGYVGTLVTQHPHDVMWPGWELAKDKPGLEGATVSIYGHLGFFAHSVEQVRAVLPMDPGARVRWEGPVPKKEILSTYEALDVLLLMVASSPYVTAGKAYEYMATGKPIVAIHSPETAASEPLRGYPLWFPVTEMTPEAVRDALVAAADRARSVTEEDFLACLEHARRFERRTVLAHLDEHLREVANV